MIKSDIIPTHIIEWLNKQWESHNKFPLSITNKHLSPIFCTVEGLEKQIFSAREQYKSNHVEFQNYIMIWLEGNPTIVKVKVPYD